MIANISFKSLSGLLLLTIVVSQLSLGAFPQTRKINVTGVVVDRAGRPVSGVFVIPTYDRTVGKGDDRIGGTVEAIQTMDDGRVSLAVDWEPGWKITLGFQAPGLGCTGLFPVSGHERYLPGKKYEISAYKSHVDLGTISSYLEFAAVGLNTNGFDMLRLSDHKGKRIATKPLDNLPKSSDTKFCLPPGKWHLTLSSSGGGAKADLLAEIDEELNVQIRPTSNRVKD